MAYRDGWQVCAPWVDPAALCCEGDQTITDCDDVEVPLVFQWTDEDYALAASNLLYNRTGRRWPGACSRTVWPCLSCNCSDHPCGCGTYDAIRLPSDYPITEIVEITIDGVPMAPAEYRLDEFDRVVKLDGTLWPSCNNLGIVPVVGATCAEISVSYIAGRVPPIELQMAAAELACELKRACNGDASCSLTGVRDHVQSISRRGVSLQLQDITELLQSGATGNAIIDHALAAYAVTKPMGYLFDPLNAGRSVEQ